MLYLLANCFIIYFLLQSTADESQEMNDSELAKEAAIDDEAKEIIQKAAAATKKKGKSKSTKADRTIPQCPICMVILETWELGKKHMVDAHGETRKHECLLVNCLKIFRRKEHLQRHMRIHNKEKPYQCDECPLK